MIKARNRHFLKSGSTMTDRQLLAELGRRITTGETLTQAEQTQARNAYARLIQEKKYA